MRKKIITFFLFFLLIIIVGCEKPVQPGDRFSEYMDLWKEQKFDEMYGLLSKEAKAAVSKEDFVGRYEKIYEDLNITDLTLIYEVKETDDSSEKISFPFQASMNSVAGEISFSHEVQLAKEETDDKSNWYVNWDSTYIFPELQEGDKIGMSSAPAVRGEILDRTGDVLALNGTLYEIGIVPGEIEGQEAEITGNLANLLGISEKQITNALNADWVKPDLFVPINKRISPDNKELIEQIFSLPGVQKQNVEGRVYPFGEAASHLIGYVGPITAEELEKNKDKGYSSTDVIGKRGLEQVLEDRLRGEDGITVYITKADGTETTLAEKPVQNGEDIQLTIDIGLQKAIFDQYGGAPGTAAAIHPLTGETLALVSSPGFDPNAAALGFTSEQRTALEADVRQPLLNRFRATYAPGSVMKPIVGAIGLNEGVTTLDKTLDVKGLTWRKDDSWGDHYVTRVKDPGGPENFEQAMMYSDNIYFAREALDLGKEKFTAGLKSFGFEEEMPYPYPLEVSKIGTLDSEGLLADSGYGQGQIEFNPLHLAAAYTAFLNKGSIIKPILFKDEEQSQIWKENVINEQAVNAVAASLVKVIQDPQGTGHSGQIEGMPLAGKTGTAELKLNKDEKGKENGWFVVYNTDNPHILLAMMQESVNESGGTRAVIEKARNVLSTR
ncbi:penicillin-binding transpeptidase domain-containing protein [Bacillaceae bacterium Marseille-Q3522]|nr:penicillin-binding transpeptidase domain-containing protein [Bacillaceae bacterium Marseille-Q3522]